MKTAILTAVLLSGASFVSAETGDQVLPKDDKVKVLVRYTNSQGKFSTTLISERNVNPFDHQASLVDRIASSARPISIKGQISQVEIEGDVDGAIEALLADDEVAEVELDFPMWKFQPVLFDQDNDASLHQERRLQETIPYGIKLVQAPDLWSATRKPKPIKICIVDTGYDKKHDDLPKNGITSSATDFEYAFIDRDGHGTHIAGIIGALGNEGGIVGVNPNSKTFSFHIAKALGDDGRGSASTVIEGIEGCLEAGAKVITLSLGGGKRSSMQETLFKQAYDDGVLIFAASGNSGTNVLEYPASYPYVISVAAVDEEEKYASFSNFNDQVELVAPGVNIKSTLPGNSYGILSGTSMAAPHVAGAAALVWSYFPNCSNNQIRNVLALAAKDVSPSSNGCNSKTGFGLIQAKTAYDLLETYGCEAGGLATLPLSEGVKGGCYDLPAIPATIAEITGSPSKDPTARPTSNPSDLPSSSPSKSPSASPSFKLFKEPLLKPSSSPTKPLPQNRTASTYIQTPSASPSQQYSQDASYTGPSQSPSSQPTTMIPTSSPSTSPSISPSSPSPSALPSNSPSSSPITNPPSASPSSSPSLNPSISPSTSPSSRSPSSNPTHSPSHSPTSSSPSENPTATPSSSWPSKSPSISPTETSTLMFKNANCEGGEVWFTIDFTFDADPSQVYWFLLDKCSRNIVFDCQDCHAKADPFSTHSFGGCVPNEGYVFYFNDYSGKSWIDGGYSVTYDGETVFDSTGNVSSSEEVHLGSQKECSKPPTTAPTSSSPTSSAPTHACASGDHRLDVQFNLDADPAGVYWFLIDRCTGPLIHDCQACFTGAQPFETKSFSKCLPRGQYSFIFQDYSGKDWLKGGYTVNYGGLEVFDSTGDVKHAQEVLLGSHLDCPDSVVTAAPQTTAPASAAPTSVPTSSPITPHPINYSTGCPSDQIRVDIEFTFGADPSKTYWYIIDRCAGKLVHDCQGCYASSLPGSSKFFYRCVPDSQYSFVFNDYSGTTWKQGGYSINYNTTKAFETKGNVEPLNEVKFGLDSCKQPSTPPTPSPIFTQNTYCEKFTLDIVTDGKSSEISWTLQEIYGDDLGIVAYGPVQGQQYGVNSVYIGAAEECLPPGEYQFSIHDDGSNGIGDPGYYKIYLNDLAIREGRHFGSVETTGFIVVDKSTSNGIFE